MSASQIAAVITFAVCRQFLLHKGNRYIKKKVQIRNRQAEVPVFRIENPLSEPLFFLINSYTTGLQPTVLHNILKLCLAGRKGNIDAYEVGLPTEEGIPLPCGAGGIFVHG